MKKQHIFSFIGGVALCATFFGVTAFRQGEESPNYVTVEAWEGSKEKDAKIMIYFENSTTEEVALEKFDQWNQYKSQLANTLKVHETINMLTHKGYHVVAAFSKNQMSSTYLLEKR